MNLGSRKSPKVSQSVQQTRGGVCVCVCVCVRTGDVVINGVGGT